MIAPTAPDFFSAAFLKGHIRQIIDFYYPRCMNMDEGGYFNEYRDDGRITDLATQHLVSTCRFIFNFAVAARLLDRPELREAAAHGVRYLTGHHRDTEFGGYVWILDQGRPRETTKHCYGHAFVLLTYAQAYRTGIAEAGPLLAETWDLLEEHFYDRQAELYTDELSRYWSLLSPYSGQNANMHMTEALLAAFEATGEARYLDRAVPLAERVSVDLADQGNREVWEHYNSDWTIDWSYNKETPRDLFRPWGYLPGHLTEWTKLLLGIERHRPLEWLLPRARNLYDVALSRGTDLAHGGLLYAYAPDGTVVDTDKYYWVHAESLAAAACLAQRTGRHGIGRIMTGYGRTVGRISLIMFMAVGIAS